MVLEERERQKHRERRFATTALTRIDSRLSARLTDFERPDFLVTDRTPTLGIEVRELFWREDSLGRPLQAAEGTQERITARAADLWREQGLPPIHINLHWSPFEVPDARSANQIADRLVHAIAGHLPEMLADGHLLKVENSGLPNDPLPDAILSANVFKTSVLHEAFWATDRAGYVGECDPDTIESALAGKESRVGTYRRNADEIWLILVISEEAPSSFVKVPASTIERRYESSFDRVFVLEATKTRVSELRVASPAAAPNTS